MNKYGKDYPKWFFVWITGNPYVTTICGWTKHQVIRNVEKDNDLKWKKIYSRGGRIRKFTLKELK